MGLKFYMHGVQDHVDGTGVERLRECANITFNRNVSWAQCGLDWICDLSCLYIQKQPNNWKAEQLAGNAPHGTQAHAGSTHTHIHAQRCLSMMRPG